jgi:hypothetical protein
VCKERETGERPERRDRERQRETEREGEIERDRDRDTERERQSDRQTEETETDREFVTENLNGRSGQAGHAVVHHAYARARAARKSPDEAKKRQPGLTAAAFMAGETCGGRRQRVSIEYIIIYQQDEHWYINISVSIIKDNANRDNVAERADNRGVLLRYFNREAKHIYIYINMSILSERQRERQQRERRERRRERREIVTSSEPELELLASLLSHVHALAHGCLCTKSKAEQSNSWGGMAMAGWRVGISVIRGHTQRPHQSEDQSTYQRPHEATSEAISEHTRAKHQSTSEGQESIYQNISEATSAAIPEAISEATRGHIRCHIRCNTK